MTCAKTFAWLTSAITKATSIAWIILAAFATQEISKRFAVDDYTLTGQTLYIPLESCRPTSILVNGKSVALDNVISNCETINYFYNVIVMSLIVSMTCVSFYLLFSLIAIQERCCSIDHRVIYGMGIFVCFPLINSAILIWMLYQLAESWIDDMTPSHDNVTVNDVEIQQVRYSGNMNILLSTAGLALSLCLFLVVDALEAAFCAAKKKDWSSANTNGSSRVKKRVPRPKKEMDQHSGHSMASATTVPRGSPPAKTPSSPPS